MALEDYDSSALASSWILQKGYPFLVRIALARASITRIPSTELATRPFLCSGKGTARCSFQDRM
jgi:hypothetical protein